ncbi:general transcription factor IIH subunit 2 isoform X6 [Cinclus cinclus]|uniref:general transcription factor IIH subunit 2 isoform X6 n=1 Tax=Cinclus cinclus TaxID=127875 RepID=UPI002E0D8A8F
MDDEPERTKRWEGGYERTWEILKEDESGSLKATIEDILFKAKRKRLYEHHGQVRLGMMRHLYVVVDGSRTMEDQDLKPNRLTCTLKIGLIVTKSKRAEKMTELSGNSKKHVTALKKAVDMNCSGEPSLYNSLNLAMQTLKQLENNSDPGLTLGGYFCPQCRAKYCELPVECKICGLTLVSAPHLARSYHHLFPLDVFQEVPLEEYKGERHCQGCQGEIKDQNVYICKVCQNAFCVECDLFVHDSLHCCPGCIHEHPAPVSV